MSSRFKVLACLSGIVSPAVLGAAMSLTATGAMAACGGPAGTPSPTQTKCLTAIAIPGQPLQSFDISWVDSKRGQYFLGDRSNAGVDVINTRSLKWERTIGGFVGAKLNANGTVNNNISGPNGVTSHGRWLYAGDGDSSLKVIDLNAPHFDALKQVIPTGGTTRLDEMALTTDGRVLLAANNAEDPPFATLFTANGDNPKSDVSVITKITVDPSILPSGPNGCGTGVACGLSLEQPAWDPTTKRFFNSIPIIANNPAGCNYGQLAGPITCQGGVLVIDPTTLSKPTAVLGAFNPTTNTGVIPLNGCAPNGATVGPNANILLGCTPRNVPSDKILLVINAVTKVQIPIANTTGADEVWFNEGDGRYYCGCSANNQPPAGPVLSVVDAGTNGLIETIPVSSSSHSVAADSQKNRIFVPQVAPASVVAGGDTTSNGAGICGTNNGCVAVYQSGVKKNGDGGNDE